MGVLTVWGGVGLSSLTCGCGLLERVKEVGVVGEVELHLLVGHGDVLGLHVQAARVVVGLRAGLVDALSGPRPSATTALCVDKTQAQEAGLSIETIDAHSGQETYVRW
jgi:hypothetical protein